MNDPATLADLLRRFAEHLAADGDATEGVAVTVERDPPFRNVAKTGGTQTVVLDEPVHFGGGGSAPDPAEHLLAAIGASLSVTLTAHAALREIAVDHVAARLSGRIHGPSFFDPAHGGQPGILDIAIELTVTSTAPGPALDALLDVVLAATPVLQTLKTPPRVTLTVQEAMRGEPISA